MRPIGMKFLTFLLLLPLPLMAEENAAEAEPEQVESETTEEAPAAEQLKSRELGEAFRNFRPSEEITADNAVSFPVDI